MKKTTSYKNAIHGIGIMISFGSSSSTNYKYEIIISYKNNILKDKTTIRVEEQPGVDDGAQLESLSVKHTTMQCAWINPKW